MASRFVCSQTGNETSDPVVSPTGFVFDRKTIEAHIDSFKNCPKTKRPLTKKDLITLCPPPKVTGTRRMISDADKAVVDTSIMPEPLSLLVASVCSMGTSSVLVAAVIFKVVEWSLLVGIPGIAFVWGLTGALRPEWTAAALSLAYPSSTVAFLGALVMVAAHGVMAVGRSGCAMTKARFLPLVSVLAYTGASCDAFVDPAFASAPLAIGDYACPTSSAVAIIPLVVALCNCQGPALTAYFTANQKAAVKMANEVRSSQ